MYIDSTGAAAGRFALNAANADTATKLKNAITIQANGSSLGSYDGSAAKTFNITYANVGAAAADHIHTQYLTSHQSLAGYAKLSGATFTGAVKFNGVYGACINFDSAFYIDHQSGKTFLGTNGETAWVGMPAAALTFRGSATRPTYNGNEVALKSDISNTAHTHAVGKGLTMSGSGGTSGTVTYSANLKSTTSLGTIGTTGKLYAVGVDANGNLCVSVPWTDTNTTYSFSGGNPTLAWGQTSTIGTAGGATYKVTMPANPNTHYITRVYVGPTGTAAHGATSNPYLKITDDNTYRNQVQIKGGGATSVASDASGNITITSTNTTYSAATSSAAGLMSASDKSKLDGIASGANAYTLPTASSATLGGVKIGSNITCSSGTISLTKANVTAALGYTPPTTNTTYTSLKNPYALTIQVNGTNKVVYDGSSAQTINFTPALLGAATSSHSHSYLPLSGGTLSGVLNCFGGGLKIGTSSESVSLTYDTSSDTLTITFP